MLPCLTGRLGTPGSLGSCLPGCLGNQTLSKKGCRLSAESEACSQVDPPKDLAHAQTSSRPQGRACQRAHLRAGGCSGARRCPSNHGMVRRRARQASSTRRPPSYRRRACSTTGPPPFPLEQSRRLPCVQAPDAATPPLIPPSPATLDKGADGAETGPSDSEMGGRHGASMIRPSPPLSSRHTLFALLR